MDDVICHAAMLPCCSQKMQFLEKTPPFSLLVIARVSGSDNLVNFNLIYGRNLANSDGPVASSSQMSKLKL